jgi:hypothetical protein
MWENDYKKQLVNTCQELQFVRVENAKLRSIVTNLQAQCSDTTRWQQMSFSLDLFPLACFTCWNTHLVSYNEAKFMYVDFSAQIPVAYFIDIYCCLCAKTLSVYFMITFFM